MLAAHYADSNLVFFPLAFDDPATHEGIHLLLPDLAQGQGPSRVWFEAETFTGRADGTWLYEAEVSGARCPPAQADSFCDYLATGVGSVWTRVPAPSTLVLFGVSLAGLVFYSRCFAG